MSTYPTENWEYQPDKILSSIQKKEIFVIKTSNPGNDSNPERSSRDIQRMINAIEDYIDYYYKIGDAYDRLKQTCGFILELGGFGSWSRIREMTESLKFRVYNNDIQFLRQMSAGLEREIIEINQQKTGNMLPKTEEKTEEKTN